MTDTQAREDAVIDQTAARWSGRGYTLLRRPTRDQVPAFLRPCPPHALAVGREPGLVIEVVRDGPISGERLRRIQKALEGQAAWRLELLYDRVELPAKLAPPSPQEIARAISGVRALATTGDRGAALVMAWATLEALARVLEPPAFEHPQTPGQVIETLTSLGYLRQEEADRLRPLASIRNALVHGQLGVDVDAADLHAFIEVLEAMAAGAGGHVFEA